MKKFICKAIVIFLIFITSYDLSFSYHKANMLTLGDIMVHDIQYQTAYDMKKGRYDFSPWFHKVDRMFSDGDIVVGNLETTFSGGELGYSGYPRFNSPDQLARDLKEAGVDFLFTANNHCYDFDSEGLLRTIKTLDANGLMHTGTFEDMNENRFEIIEVEGIKFGFLNYTYGINGRRIAAREKYMVNFIEYDDISEDIAKIRDKVDFVVVGMHFGEEYVVPIKDYEKRMVEKILDSGADVILGNHPHVLRKMNFYRTEDGRNAFVIYSQGNFISAQRELEKKISVITDITFTKNFLGKPEILMVENHPIYTRRKYDNGLKFEVFLLDEYIDNKAEARIGEVEELEKAVIHFGSYPRVIINKELFSRYSAYAKYAAKFILR